MVLMLPITTDNGARLAAILPTGLAAVGRGIGAVPAVAASDVADDRLPAIRSFIMVVADGLGHANLAERAGHAPTLSKLPRRRIETVTPSTTGAALTSLTTGVLPGEHGLIGYRIRHPQLGLVTTLRDWAGIDEVRSWQRATPLFTAARDMGARPVAIGRPAHATGGLTAAILSGAEYLPGARIEDRFATASRVVREGEPSIIYLYIDELDQAAHEFGWQSETWASRLERFDASLEALLQGLPGDVGVVVTADHGIVDVPQAQHVMLDAEPNMLADVVAVGGEPRFRSLYLREGADAVAVARRWAAAEAGRAWVATREEAIRSGCFGAVAADVAPRLGEVIIAARKRVAYYCSDDDPRALAMIGQHGSLTEEERGVPLALAGALAGSGFAAAVAATAKRIAAASAESATQGE